MSSHNTYNGVHENSRLARQEFSVILRGSAPPPGGAAIALTLICAAIHPAEAQVCANWVFLRKETLLETLLFLNNNCHPERSRARSFSSDTLSKVPFGKRQYNLARSAANGCTP